MAETGIIGAQKENVLIEAGACVVSVLPHLGGKIASIRINQHELLQSPLAPLASRDHTMTFDASDASGWDECLPSVAACTVPTSRGPVRVPDHGDLWRVEWERQGTRDQGTEEPRERVSGLRDQGSGITLRGECFSLPLVLERTLTLFEKRGGWRLDLDYKLTNTGSFPAPWSWAAHPLFTVEPWDRVVLPEKVRSLRLEGSGGGRLGKTGDTVAWPIAKASAGDVDLREVQPADSGIADKLFAGPLRDSEDWCALERQSIGLRIKAGFDPVATPYLGLWICYGGWPDRMGSRQNCVALEPSTAPVDSLAIAGPWSRRLEPGQGSKWAMHVDFEAI